MFNECMYLSAHSFQMWFLHMKINLYLKTCTFFPLKEKKKVSENVFLKPQLREK